jgi:putative spermidine/putrescine transport system permease protein
MPGILASLLIVLVRTLAMFELTFFTSGPSSQTLVVALYYAVFAAGVRAVQSIDAMAVIYMVTTLVWLLIALRFINPTQLVTRSKRDSGA